MPLACRAGIRHKIDSKIQAGEPFREKPMKRLTISRILTAGTAAGAVLLAAQAIAVAQERGSSGVINDASGNLAGAFVK